MRGGNVRISDVRVVGDTGYELEVVVPAKVGGEARLYVPHRHIDPECSLHKKGDTGVLIVSKAWAEGTTARYEG